MSDLLLIIIRCQGARVAVHIFFMWECGIEDGEIYKLGVITFYKEMRAAGNFIFGDSLSCSNTIVATFIKFCYMSASASFILKYSKMKSKRRYLIIFLMD